MIAKGFRRPDKKQEFPWLAAAKQKPSKRLPHQPVAPSLTNNQLLKPPPKRAKHCPPAEDLRPQNTSGRRLGVPAFYETPNRCANTTSCSSTDQHPIPVDDFELQSDDLTLDDENTSSFPNDLRPQSQTSTQRTRTNDDEPAVKTLTLKPPVLSEHDRKPFFVRCIPTSLPKILQMGILLPHPAESTLKAVYNENLALPERLRPVTRRQLVGNARALDEIESWLRRKNAARTSGVHHGGNDCEPVALLLYGPAGCGKTSALQALLNDAGKAFTEWSPANPFQSTGGAAQAGLGNNLEAVYQGTVAAGGGSAALVIEEVDGITTPEVLARCLGETKNHHAPVIMTCNDRYAPSLRGIHNHPRVKCVRFYPLKKDEMHSLLRNWTDALAHASPTDGRMRRWMERPEHERNARLAQCDGDARKLLTQQIALVSRTRWESDQRCEWRDIDRWLKMDALARARSLLDTSSQWQENRLWMASSYREDILATSDPCELDRFAAGWSDSDLLDALHCDAHASDVQLLLLQTPPSEVARQHRQEWDEHKRNASFKRLTPTKPKTSLSRPKPPARWHAGRKPDGSSVLPPEDEFTALEAFCSPRELRFGETELETEETASE